MLDWPLVVSPRSNKELCRARSAAHPTGHRASTRLITHAKRGSMEHIARWMCRSAAVHSNDTPVRRTRQCIAETLKQCSLSGLACSSAGRGQNIRCPHARGPVCSFSPHPGTSGHAFCSISSSAASTSALWRAQPLRAFIYQRGAARPRGNENGNGNGERSAVMSVLNVAGPGNRAPPRIVPSVESDSGVVTLASLASLSILFRATN
jgi:hypothetical protein